MYTKLFTHLLVSAVYSLPLVSVVAVEQLANSVEDTGGCYFVPAFSGLFCPYWQPNARGYETSVSIYVIHCVLSVDCFVRTGNPMHVAMRHLCLLM